MSCTTLAARQRNAHPGGHKRYPKSVPLAGPCQHAEHRSLPPCRSRGKARGVERNCPPGNQKGIVRWGARQTASDARRRPDSTNMLSDSGPEASATRALAASLNICLYSTYWGYVVHNISPRSLCSAYVHPLGASTPRGPTLPHPYRQRRCRLRPFTKSRHPGQTLCRYSIPTATRTPVNA